MRQVLIPKEIWNRLGGHNGLRKGAAEFVKCCQEGRPPPRVYKPSDIARDGSVFQPYLRLDLHHHHLHRNGDLLLVTQHIGDAIVAIALAKHATYLLGDKMLWLQEHVEIIDWTLCEDLIPLPELIESRNFGNLVPNLEGDNVIPCGRLIRGARWANAPNVRFES